jgi:hypothetical protein
MAHLEVKPKTPYPWWVWALLLIIVIVVALILFHVYVDGDVPSKASAFVAPLLNRKV